MPTAEDIGSEFAVKIGERVKTLRKQRGLKQKTLADMLGYKSHTAIVHLEAGLQAPSLEMTLLLARALGVSLQELLGDLLFDETQEDGGLPWLTSAREKATTWTEEYRLAVAGLLESLARELKTVA